MNSQAVFDSQLEADSCTKQKQMKELIKTVCFHSVKQLDFWPSSPDSPFFTRTQFRPGFESSVKKIQTAIWAYVK